MLAISVSVYVLFSPLYQDIYYQKTYSKVWVAMLPLCGRVTDLVTHMFAMCDVY